MLRNPQAMDSARRQVMFALNDYLAGIALDQLSNQAAVGGISFSTGANNGLMVNANGYTQHLPALFSDLLQGYFSYTPTEEQLEQAKSWYAQMMDSAEKGKAYDSGDYADPDGLAGAVLPARSAPGAAALHYP
ncbi:protease III [Klebsiella pneumoniae]|uniref:Protease III n=1 Tax=Klebsiella pneumoniae TaxID=573 RepID=A0A377TZI7_KLEPN|nr:protease III [Klebsiella pneumoniae]